MHTGPSAFAPLRAPKVVALGGGSGPGLIARALPHRLDEFTAVVTAVDSGSSTGVIRSSFGLPAPGDIRATLATLARLADPGSPWPDLLEFRFRPADGGPLRNMALGNLLLAGLALKSGDFARGVADLAALAGIRGRVFPACSQPAHLAARLDDGTVVRGELAVRALGKPRIRELFMEQATEGFEQALQAVREADFLFLGPGNLFTSVVATLVVPGMAEAVRLCRGKRIYIANTTTVPGQTDGFSALDHVETVMRHLGDGALDHVVLNSEQPGAPVLALYADRGVTFIPVHNWEAQAIVAHGAQAILGDLLEPAIGQVRQLHKLDTIRHDPAKLGAVLAEVFDLGGTVTAPIPIRRRVGLP